MRALKSDLLLLGVAGKMGPTLARMAKRASDAAGVKRRVIGVSRFSNAAEAEKLRAVGVETIQCDLLDEAAVNKLPDVPNVLFMAGMKFGATGNESLTWAMNVHVPSLVCRRFAHSRIVAFSTGNVYGLTPVARAGSVEADTPAPVGEYAMSCLGRERMFEHFSRAMHIPVALIRLNYAVELRYGVLVDLARKVWAGEPVPLAMGHFNCLWQGDANAMTLAAFAHTSMPPFVLNMTGPELLNVRAVCEGFAKRLNRRVTFTGSETATALLSNARKCFQLFGPPRVGVEQMMDWIADWVMRGHASLGKPTHFESRDGKF
ncbi:MAG: NAD-dependent epimerase/dehydratase family protein [Verrucomicrobia bacterium]|nr:NAD-dependent epimerase/dehydratase family protein [Verrucomicrobiota bacterium]